MSVPSLSVIIPNYNHGRFLPQCLDAIFRQETAPGEVLIIDDASTDDSLEVIERYRKLHPTVRLLRNETNRGAVQTITRGLMETDSEYVYFAAADDWVLPGLFSRSLELLGQYPQAGFCSALSLQVTEQNRNPHEFLTPVVCSRPGFISPQRARELLYRHGTWFLGNALVLRRQAVMEMGGFRPELHSFCDGFLYHLLALKYGACFIPEPLAVWRRLDSGFSGATVANIDRMETIRERVTGLITGPYHALFGDRLIQRWLSRWRFTTLNAQLRSGGYEAGALARSWPQAKAVDRRVLDLAKGSPVGRRAGTLYLFARLRPGDLVPIAARRLRWALRRLVRKPEPGR